MSWKQGDLSDLMPYKVVEEFPSGRRVSRFWSWGEAIRYRRLPGQVEKRLVFHRPKDCRGALLLLLAMRGHLDWTVWWEPKHPGPGWFFDEEGGRVPSLLGGSYRQAVEFIRSGTLDLLAQHKNTIETADASKG